ncbi:hypothetical protein pneo_cds_725 [Pandoravirus neocaledonia]|uniref:Uncharacterized protein n=1 Tax=Pandoravirus neocaledonia TaxID=2107708 RepID=A0A2U7UD54_9VIRU|nr:hypothetical protein pneo_cds_725 [Pandoravirus neocaledonia]AVK76332.1 hypothetical protein pneo_cds_725 [Pandoravirus neocaledonia]
MSGRLETLQWARANGCPWDERVCIAATTFRCLDVLKWAVENGCPCYRGMWTERERDDLEWARKYGYPWDRHIPDSPQRNL